MLSFIFQVNEAQKSKCGKLASNVTSFIAGVPGTASTDLWFIRIPPRYLYLWRGRVSLLQFIKLTSFYPACLSSLDACQKEYRN